MVDVDTQKFEAQLKRNSPYLKPWTLHVGRFAWLALGAFIIVAWEANGSDLFFERYFALVVQTGVLIFLFNQYIRFQFATVALLRRHGLLPPAPKP